MYTQFDSTVKATICFLKLVKVKVNNSSVTETLQSHPNWPSLLCMVDSLNKWKIPNGAGKIDPHDIDQLTTPFIAQTTDREAPLAIVTQVGDTAIQVYQKNYKKVGTELKRDFIKKWSGVYLIAEPNEHSREHNYEKNKRNAFLNILIPVLAFSALMITSFLLVTKIVGEVSRSSSFLITGLYLQWLVLLAGVVVTSLLLWYQMDKNNPVLQKICTGIAKGNCHAILTGKQSKLFSWLSWSEVGFFYFAGGLLTILFAGNNIVNSIALVAWLNILALPYFIFSIYYQWFVAKQWCMLCLAVQALLILGAVNITFNSFFIPVSIFSLSFILNAILSYLLPVLIWYAVKPYIVRLQELNNTKWEYQRIKFNSEIFDALLKKQKSITAPTEGLGISLGNSAATNTLIKVCNPYCGPCAKAHLKIESLLDNLNNLQVKILFNAPNEEDNMMTKPVKHLLAIDAKKDEVLTKKALDDWYLTKTKDYDAFAAKYPMNGELKQQDEKVDAMAKWCKKMGVQFTPTIFINGYQLPDAYSIEDLQYFLLE